MKQKQIKIAVIGVGYVGLPLAVEFSKVMDTLGYDVNPIQIDNCKTYYPEVCFTCEEKDLTDRNFYIVTVPTPVDENNLPDFKCLQRASRTIGKYLKKNDVVVFESTVYPGAAQEICIPILEEVSKLRSEKDFHIGYSPERINCGDGVNTIRNTVKIVSSKNKEILQYISDIYQKIILPPIFQTQSLEEAEAAKIIENCQRDINIAFLNEVTILMHKIGLDMKSILAACKTKWNFLDFHPGLVGGHCVGVDPYYLIAKGERMGSSLSILKTARTINEKMVYFIKDEIEKAVREKEIRSPQILIMGVTFKENINDTRNSKSIKLIELLKSAGYSVKATDPYIEEDEGTKILGNTFVKEIPWNNDIVVLAVSHREYYDLDLFSFKQHFKNNHSPILFDIKGIFQNKAEKAGYYYWNL